MQSIDNATTSTKPVILIVDDAPQNLIVIGDLLEPYYHVRVANSGEHALEAVKLVPPPDLILLDIMMPGIDGYEVLRRLHADPSTKTIPVIFVTAMDSTESEEHGLSLGAVDYITKPINPAIVLARVRTHLELKQARDILAHQNEWLDAEVKHRMRENLLIQALAVRALACVAEVRDDETGRHIVRTQSYIDILARHLANHPRFKEALAGSKIDLIVQAAPLHDIGKVGIPDAILRKPGKLTPDEFAIMKQHPSMGAAAIEEAIQQTLATLDDYSTEEAQAAFAFLRMAQEISLNHHEKWDGSGYPRGLKGEAIPVSARLMALADVFDALINRRVYKAPFSLEETTRIIREGRGTHFDPEVVDAFLVCHDEFAAVAQRLAEPTE